MKTNSPVVDQISVEHDRVKEALPRDGGRYRTLFDLAPVAVYSCDLSGVILEYNNRAGELWGRKPEVGDTDERFCGSFKLYRPDGSFMPHEQCPMGDVLSGKVASINDAEVHIERPDGSRIIAIVNIAPLRDERGEVTGAINCFYDVTERRMIEKALSDSEARVRLENGELESGIQKRTSSLHQLSAKLMRVQDVEHRRIARNLHDSLGQYLSNAKIQLGILSGSATPEQAGLVSAALDSIEQSITETRTLSYLLHPPLLDEVGFASAARCFVDEFAKRSKIEVKLEFPSGTDRLPEAVELTLFRILQESLTNVHRHSGSSSVEIALSVTGDEVRLTVRDFGCGIHTGVGEPKDNQVGVGLNGMRERVTDLGGTFTVESDSHGTAIVVALPLAGRASTDSRPSRNPVSHSAA